MVWGSTIQEHNESLEKSLQRVQKHGLMLNRAKCQFCVKEITFLGDKLSSEGVQPDHAKVKAVREMANPTDRKCIQRVLGMVNYLGKFIKPVSLNSELKDTPSG